MGQPTASAQPALYEVFARHWAPHGFADVPDAELDRIAALGFDYLWVMGVWTTGAIGRDLARAAFADHSPSEIESSPYAIARYVVDPRYGGNDALAALRKRLAQRHVGLILDFVPNHTARDHDWIQSNPDIYVQDGSGIACGKDPYFPPWTDTAQLDHRLVKTRLQLIETLKTIATQCDGVRCDMAMLVLSDVFAKTWSHVPPRGELAPGEFWAWAIQHAVPPDFIWIAEAYWGLESRLQALGFDFTYDKALYDHLVHAGPREVRGDLTGSLDYQGRSARFLENHDEPRLARTLAPERAAAALAIAMTSPGLRFVHDGQIEGRRLQAAIQLAKRPDEAVDPFYQAIHARLLALKRVGSFAMLQVADGRLVAYRWDPGLIVIVNYSDQRVQSRVTLDLHGIAGRRLVLHDVMDLDDATYERDGSAPLYVDLRPWQAHVFTVTTKGLWHG